MTGRQSQRQRGTRNARMRAAAAARKKAMRRRWAMGIGAGALVTVAIAVFLVNQDDANKTEVATSASTTTPAGEGSVAGEPCVPVSSPLPEGAPEVPVKEGPPPTELVIEDLKVGDGAVVTPTDTLTVNYIGVSCSTGAIFDSSYQRGEPATFPLSGVIPGWQEGLPGVKVGGQRLLGIPSAMAYGPQGQPPSIAPDEALWFVVEVVEAKTA